MTNHPPPPRIGSFCSGYRGLDMAVEAVFGGTTAWVSDVDPGANQILAHHWPDVPNIGDLTTADYSQIEPVDIVCGGYPCQPFSVAGQRKGTSDERHIWPYIADALRVLRPRIAVFENVAGHLRLGFADVLADLARLGFDAEWCLVRASEVGAPHRRERLFILAVAADAPREGLAREGLRGRPAERGADAADTDGHALRQQPVAEPGCRGTTVAELAGTHAAADTDRRGLARHPERDIRTDEPGQQAPRRNDARRPGLQRGTAPDTAGQRHGHPGPAGERGVAAPAVASRAAANADPDGDGREEQQRSEPGLGPRGDADGRGPQRWGRYGPAVARWEAVTGRRAPWATDDRHRLSPAFVEWMMGLEAGHVTDVPGLTRTQQLKALGNGVVQQQAAAAIRLLADRAQI
jgi:DNA (cytosine-5)-methyltransferase 1